MGITRAEIRSQEGDKRCKAVNVAGGICEEERRELKRLGRESVATCLGHIGIETQNKRKR